MISYVFSVVLLAFLIIGSTIWFFLIQRRRPTTELFAYIPPETLAQVLTSQNNKEAGRTSILNVDEIIAAVNNNFSILKPKMTEFILSKTTSISDMQLILGCLQKITALLFSIKLRYRGDNAGMFNELKAVCPVFFDNLTVLQDINDKLPPQVPMRSKTFEIFNDSMQKYRICILELLTPLLFPY